MFCCLQTLRDQHLRQVERQDYISVLSPICHNIVLLSMYLMVSNFTAGPVNRKTSDAKNDVEQDERVKCGVKQRVGL